MTEEFRLGRVAMLPGRPAWTGWTCPGWPKSWWSRLGAIGIQLTGNKGLLTALTQKVWQSALAAERADHLGRDRYERTGEPAGHSSSDMD